jgi:hypothetical protein
MSRTQTAIHLKGIAQVLAEQRLQVPVHQRPFEWEEQVGELLEDVEIAFGGGPEEYFLGTLVIISGVGAQPPNLLDGQQRLATVTLLLAAMAEEYDAVGDTRSATSLRDNYLAKFDIVSKVESPQLRLNEADDPYFRTLLRSGYSAPARSAPASHKRLHNARKNVGAWLTKRLLAEADKPGWLGRVFKFLNESAYVIHLTVPDESNAFLIFETLNDRGLDLSIADLLKNYLLSKAGDDLRSDDARAWSGFAAWQRCSATHATRSTWSGRRAAASRSRSRSARCSGLQGGLERSAGRHLLVRVIRRAHERARLHVRVAQ